VVPVSSILMTVPGLGTGEKHEEERDEKQKEDEITDGYGWIKGLLYSMLCCQRITLFPVTTPPNCFSQQFF